MSFDKTTSEKPMTGRTVFYWLVGFFSIMIVANIIFIYFALNSWPGVMTQSSYKSGLKFNQDVRNAAEQDKLGWHIEGAFKQIGDGHMRIMIEAHDRDDQGLTNLEFSLTLRHPATDKTDHKVQLREVKAGIYQADLTDVAAGQWNVDMYAKDGAGHSFRSTSRIYLR